MRLLEVRLVGLRHVNVVNIFILPGATLEIITDKSQEGAQFCKGFGGIGGKLYCFLFNDHANVSQFHCYLLWKPVMDSVVFIYSGVIFF